MKLRVPFSEKTFLMTPRLGLYVVVVCIISVIMGLGPIAVNAHFFAQKDEVELHEKIIKKLEVMVSLVREIEDVRKNSIPDITDTEENKKVELRISDTAVVKKNLDQLEKVVDEVRDYDVDQSSAAYMDKLSGISQEFWSIVDESGQILDIEKLKKIKWSLYGAEKIAKDIKIHELEEIKKLINGAAEKTKFADLVSFSSAAVNLLLIFLANFFIFRIEQKKIAAEMALEISEELYKFAAELAEIGVWSRDVETGKVERDSKCDEILDIAEDEYFSHKMFVEMISKEDRERMAMTPINSLAREGGVFKEEFSVQTYKGSKKILRIMGRQLEDQKSGRPFVLGILQDITQFKAQEEDAIAKAQLEMKNRILELSNRELETFSYSVAHDLKSPLRSIGGFTKILAEDATNSPDERKMYLELIIKSSDKMAHLIDDLLSLTKISQQGLEKKAIDLNSVFSDAFEEAKLAYDRSRNITFVEYDNTPHCYGDLTLLRCMAFNLVSNALKFTQKREATVIEFGSEVGEHGETVYFLADNGVGFDMKYYKKLFGVFHRLHSTTEYAGTGVGLAIVQKVVSKHGGKVWAVAEVNKGATFYFTLEKSE